MTFRSFHFYTMTKTSLFYNKNMLITFTSTIYNGIEGTNIFILEEGHNETTINGEIRSKTGQNH
ncbi:hypothetical protein LIBO111022_04800 [Listeria booriae]|nr:Uncharacterised protein [Listeria booriae]